MVLHLLLTSEVTDCSDRDSNNFDISNLIDTILWYILLQGNSVPWALRLKIKISTVLTHMTLAGLK